MRRFVLRRMEDETGVSGTGDVAEGVVFSDGTAAMRWRTAQTSTAIYSSIEALEAIHGHGGRTQVVFTDPPPIQPLPPKRCPWCDGAGLVSCGPGIRGVKPCPYCCPVPGARP